MTKERSPRWPAREKLRSRNARTKLLGRQIIQVHNGEKQIACCGIVALSLVKWDYLSRWARTQTLLSSCYNLPAARGKLHSSRTVRSMRWTARVCVLVLVLAGFAQLIHFHPAGTGKTQSCAACVANHSPVVIPGFFHLAPERLPAGSVVLAVSASVRSHANFSKPIRSPPTPELG